MNPAYDRYFDRHVREDSSLEEVAEGYVQSYAGDFLFLVDCRDRLADGGRLTVAQVRGVLNCMRADPRVGNLPVPGASADRVTLEMPGGNVIDIATRRPPAVSRQPWFDIPVRWHLGYGISTHKRACVVHRVHRDSTIRYYPHATQKPFADRFQCRLRWVCTPNLRTDAVEMLDRDAADAQAAVTGWSYCATCVRLPEYHLTVD